MKKQTGVIAVLVSAIFFGIGPMFVSKSFAGGNNGSNAAFVRMVFPFIVLSIADRCTPVSIWYEAAGRIYFVDPLHL